MDIATDLVEESLRILGERLPPGWRVTRSVDTGPGDRENAALFEFTTQSGMANGLAFVEVKRSFAAADIERLLGGLTRRLRDAFGHRTILLVSEFLSPRTRELLAAEDVSYLDLTGNIRLVMQMPPIFVETSGAERWPQQRNRERLVGISRGYVSRILNRLADEALIERETRGPVEAVDWPALLRERGRAVDLVTANASRTYLSPNGARGAFEAIVRSGLADDVVVTGSFAAVRVAPVAAPALLILYLKPVGGDRSPFDSVAERLGLLPADESPDVFLLEPADSSVLDRTRTVGGLEMIGYPQLVVDCLGGTGRMPSEAEAVLDWMQANESAWRCPTLSAYLAAGRP